MTQELFDIVDENDNIIGQEKRDHCHENPKVIHRVVHLLILNNEGKILVHQRSWKKKYGAGAWQLLSGGHVSAGEIREVAAQRELLEETGLKAKCFEIGKHVFHFNDQSELASLHVCLADNKPVPNEEVEVFKFIEITKLNTLPGYESFNFEDIEEDFNHIWLKLLSKKQKETEKLLGVKFAM